MTLYFILSIKLHSFLSLIVSQKSFKSWLFLVFQYSHKLNCEKANITTKSNYEWLLDDFLFVSTPEIWQNWDILPFLFPSQLSSQELSKIHYLRRNAQWAQKKTTRIGLSLSAMLSIERINFSKMAKTVKVLWKIINFTFSRLKNLW